MNNVPIPPGVVHLDDSLGAAFLGHAISTLLYGTTTLQVYLYYKDNQKDGATLKLSIFVLWILDSLHAGLIIGAMYWYCVTSFTNLFAIQQPIWPIPTMIIVSNISNSLVRSIFGFRLWQLSKHNWVLPCIIGMFSIAIFVDASYFAVKLYSIPFYSGITAFSWSLYFGLAMEAIVDVIVTITQCMLLRGFRSGSRRTEVMIRTLIAYSINTGLLTSLCAIGALVAYAAAPAKFIYFPFYFALSKLYVNSLLASVNARGSMFETGRCRHVRPEAGQNKITFRTPTLSAGMSSSYDPSSADIRDDIEFAEVVSGETSIRDGSQEDKDKAAEVFP